MNERVVTIDGKDYPLGDDFMVVSDAKPDRAAGHLSLPEAAARSIPVKIIIDHPNRDEEREIVRRHGHRSAIARLMDFGLAAVADSAALAAGALRK